VRDAMNLTTTLFSRRSPLFWIERGLLLVAVLCLGFWVYVWLDAAWVQHRDNEILDAVPDSAPPADFASVPAASASETDPLSQFQSPPPGELTQPVASPAEGSLVGRVEIPRLGVSAIILEGVDSTTLRRGVGHIPETPLPGGTGNVGLAAHRDSFFRGLKGIRKDDLVKVKTLDGTYRYRVEWTRIVDPEDTEVLIGEASPELTLVTCYPFNYVGSAPHRFIVRARQIDDGDAGAPSPGGG
jgi:sortase A